MLVLENEAELHSTITKLSEMSDAELDTYQISKGYKSLAKIAEDIYFSVDPKNFATEKEMLDFLTANKDYITLEEDANGELTAEPTLYKNVYKHIINEDQMFEINGTAYKVFEEGMVSAPKNQVNELMSLDSKNLQAIHSNKEFTYIPFQNEPLTKASLAHSHSIKNRDKVAVQLIKMSNFINNTKYCFLTIRADTHKSTLGIWWVAKRTIYYSFNLTSTSNSINPGDLDYVGSRMDRSVIRHIHLNEPVANLNIVTMSCSASSSKVSTAASISMADL